MNIEMQIDASIVSRVLQRISSGELFDSVLMDIAKKLRNAVVGRTPVGIPPDSPAPGTAKSSWTQPTVSGSHEVAFRSDVPYITTLEYGSFPGQRPWPRPGPRTTMADSPEGSRSMIYSRQAPGGMFSWSVRHIDVDAVANTVLQAYLTAFGGA
jgi:hypothetical protein